MQIAKFGIEHLLKLHTKVVVNFSSFKKGEKWKDYTGKIRIYESDYIRFEGMSTQTKDQINEGILRRNTRILEEYPEVADALKLTLRGPLP